MKIQGQEKRRNTYDKKGNLIKSTDSLGRSIEFLYNEGKLAVERIEPDKGRWETEYDQRGNIKVMRNPFGEETRFTYDNLNRIIKK